MQVIDLTQLFHKQAELDRFIAQSMLGFKIKQTHNTWRLAFLCELAELLNELKTFKWWSKKADKIQWQKAIEEFSDVLHFTFSKALLLQSSKRIYQIQPLDFADYIAINNVFLDLFTNSNPTTPKAIETILQKVLAIGLSFAPWTKLKECYLAKNQANVLRQKNDY